MPRPLPGRLAALLIAVLAVAGCETPPPAALPDITFANLPGLSLDLARIEVAQSYDPPLSEPHVDHLLQTPPMSVLRRWAEERLIPIGPAGTGTLTIVDASIVEEALARTPGLSGVLRQEQSERYTARFAVRLDFEDPNTGQSGYSEASIERSITVAENATLNDRERVWFELTEQTAHDLDARFEEELRQSVPELVRR
ncbi:MAG: hypothetical protein HKM95_08990 [Inquilinus sp.]|nr:hypothetical protein [Inquilinus sp.]